MEDRASRGGKARAAALTPEERSESARKAAQSRWRKNIQHSVEVLFSQPYEMAEPITSEITKVYGTPSTLGVESCNTDSRSSVITLNKTGSYTQ